MKKILFYGLIITCCSCTNREDYTNQEILTYHSESVQTKDDKMKIIFSKIINY